MAIDSRISLAIQGPSLTPSSQVINTFQNALTQGQNRRIREQQFAQNELVNPLQAQIFQQQATAGQQQQEVDVENRTLQLLAEQGNLIRPVLESGNTAQALSMFSGLREKLVAANLPTQGTDRIIQQLQSGDSQGVLNAIDAVQQNARGRGLLGVSQLSVGQRDFNSNVAAVKADPNLETIEGRAASVALGLTAKASLTKDERIANNKALGERVAEQKGAEASATEGAKLTKQLKHKPAITRAVKLAQKEATERGEVLTDLARMEAGLPGLNDAVSQLKELSAIATSTIGGKIFDAAVKQTGFGATKGSTARAKMIAIIANQTLPLLKETFGAAFTETEGKRLEASFADPDATHEERIAQLDAFINQKVRTIETKQRQLEASEGQTTAPTIIRFDAQGNQI